MKKLGLVAIMLMAICVSATAQLECSTKQAVIQHYMAKRFTFAPFDVDKDGSADHSDILEWHKLYDFAEVNDDGIVTEDDVKAIQKAISKKEKYNIKYDVNLDNDVDMQDVVYLQRTIANIEKKNSPYDINKDGLLSDIDLILLQTVIPVIVNYGKSLDTNKDGKVSFQDVK